MSSSTSSLPLPSDGKYWFDTGQASRFLQLLDPRALVFNFSWYSEKGTRTKLPKALAGGDATYRNAPYDKDFAYFLALFNGHQRAIYVCMNVLGAKNGSEARTDENVARVRAIFADFDEGLPKKKFPIKPTCLVHTSNDAETGIARYQAFWRVSGVSLEEFDSIEARLVADWGADPNSVNLSRIQRLPGYWHQKHGVPHLVSIVDESDRTYSCDEIAKAFPPTIAEPKADRKSTTSKLSERQGETRKQANRANGQASGRNVDVAALRSALAHLAHTKHPNAQHGETYADDYDAWVRFGLAIKRALGDDGFEVWDEWARTSKRHPGRSETQAKWDSFDVNARSDDRAITLGSIFHAAQRHGWSRVKFSAQEKLARVLTTTSPWGVS